MKKVLSIIFSLSVLIFCAPAGLFAWGTSADTAITNAGDRGTTGQADTAGDSILNFENPVGIGNYTACNNVTISTVAAGYDMSALPSPSDTSWYAGASRIFTYIVTNRANISDTVGISVAESSSAGGFTGAVYSIRTNGVVVSGPSATPSWTTPGLAADASIAFDVVVSVPSGMGDGAWNIFAVTAKDQAGSGANDQWPGLDALAPASPDMAGNRDSQSDAAMTTVVGPNLSLAKSFTVVGGASSRPRPFDTVEYTSTYLNSGSGTANNVYLVDFIPANTVYVVDSAETNNALHAGAATVEYYKTAETVWAGDTYDAAGTVGNISKIRWTLSAGVNPSDTGTIKYRVLVE